jgi:hypothetical protein
MLGLAVGIFVGSGFNNRKASGDIGKDVQKFRDVLTQIQTEYVDTVNTIAWWMTQSITCLIN